MSVSQDEIKRHIEWGKESRTHLREEAPDAVQLLGEAIIADTQRFLEQQTEPITAQSASVFMADYIQTMFEEDENFELTSPSAAVWGMMMICSMICEHLENQSC